MLAQSALASCAPSLPEKSVPSVDAPSRVLLGEADLNPGPSWPSLTEPQLTHRTTRLVLHASESGTVCYPALFRQPVSLELSVTQHCFGRQLTDDATDVGRTYCSTATALDA